MTITATGEEHIGAHQVREGDTIGIYLAADRGYADLPNIVTVRLVEVEPSPEGSIRLTDHTGAAWDLYPHDTVTRYVGAP